MIVAGNHRNVSKAPAKAKKKAVPQSMDSVVKSP